MSPLHLKARHALESLKVTVKATLDRKKKPGQYAVVWHKDRIEYLAPFAAAAKSTPLQPGFMVVHGNRPEDLRGVAVEWMKRHPMLEDLQHMGKRLRLAIPYIA
ncbi:hypothetical protein [Billgrantia endophytica]|uniref:hypothetical protein n=1 Tax=Billgrantia endophytica TaxID=2033802 RepID=UPI00197AF43F|nr:hypothetical protein [Halomonas endophytica]